MRGTRTPKRHQNFPLNQHNQNSNNTNNNINDNNINNYVTETSSQVYCSGLSCDTVYDSILSNCPGCGLVNSNAINLTILANNRSFSTANLYNNNNNNSNNEIQNNSNNGNPQNSIDNSNFFNTSNDYSWIFSGDFPEDLSDDSEYIDESDRNNRRAKSNTHRNKASNNTSNPYRTRRVVPQIEVTDAELDRQLEEAEKLFNEENEINSQNDLNSQNDELNSQVTNNNSNYNNNTHQDTSMADYNSQNDNVDNNREDYDNNDEEDNDDDENDVDVYEQFKSTLVQQSANDSSNHPLFTNITLDDDEDEEFQPVEGSDNTSIADSSDEDEEHRTDRMVQISKQELEDLKREAAKNAVAQIKWKSNALAANKRTNNNNNNDEVDLPAIPQVRSRTRKGTIGRVQSNNNEIDTGNTQQTPTTSSNTGPVQFASNTQSLAALTSNAESSSFVTAPIAAPALGFTDLQRTQLRQQVSTSVQLLLSTRSIIHHLAEKHPEQITNENMKFYKEIVHYLLQNLQNKVDSTPIVNVPIFNLWNSITSADPMILNELDPIFSKQRTDPSFIYPNPIEIGWPQAVNNNKSGHNKNEEKKECDIKEIEEWCANYSIIQPKDDNDNSLTSTGNNSDRIFFDPKYKPHIIISHLIKFTPAEDQLLLRAFHRFGYIREGELNGELIYHKPEWDKIQARYLPGRSTKAIRAHYYFLKPQLQKNTQIALINKLSTRSRRKLSRPARKLSPEEINKVEEVIQIFQSEEFNTMKRINFWQVTCQQFFPDLDRKRLRRLYIDYVNEQNEKIQRAKAVNNQYLLNQLKVPMLPPTLQNKQKLQEMAQEQKANGQAENKQDNQASTQPNSATLLPNNNLFNLQRPVNTNTMSTDNNNNDRNKNFTTTASSSNSAAISSSFPAVTPVRTMLTRRTAASAAKNDNKNNNNNNNNNSSTNTVQFAPIIEDVPTPTRRKTRNSSSTPQSNRGTVNSHNSEEQQGIVFDQLDIKLSDDEQDLDYIAEDIEKNEEESESSSDSSSLESEVEEEYGTNFSQDDNYTLTSTNTNNGPFNATKSKRRILQTTQQYNTNAEETADNGHQTFRSNTSPTINDSNKRLRRERKQNSPSNSSQLNSNNSNSVHNNISNNNDDNNNNSGTSSFVWSTTADMVLLSLCGKYGHDVNQWPMTAFVQLQGTNNSTSELTLQSVIHRLTQLMQHLLQQKSS